MSLLLLLRSSGAPSPISGTVSSESGAESAASAVLRFTGSASSDSGSESGGTDSSVTGTAASGSGSGAEGEGETENPVFLAGGGFRRRRGLQAAAHRDRRIRRFLCCFSGRLCRQLAPRADRRRGRAAASPFLIFT